MGDNTTVLKAPADRQTSATSHSAPTQLPSITENRNESTDTLLGINLTRGFNMPPHSVPSSAPATVDISTGLPSTANGDGRQLPEPDVSTPIFPMSPEVEYENPFQMAASPEYIPTPVPLARRDSLAASSFSLAAVRSEDESVAGSTLSDATGSHFRELDERLRLFMLDNESHIKNIPADQISTKPLTVQEKLALPFSFECAFGWSGDPQELEETPKNKEAFLGKLSEAKNGCTFIHRTLMEYQMEINSRKNHKFNLDFLKQQNDAIVITRHQLDQIEEHIDEVVEEVYAISDDDEGPLLTGELGAAYQHVYPWVMRTKRVVYDNHVWYKLNYVMGAHAKPLNPPNKNGKPIPKTAPVGSGTQTNSAPVQNGKAVSNGTKTLILPNSAGIRATPASRN